MMRADGFSRRALRIAWRAWRSASAVTAQVLTMIVFSSPAAAAWPRMTSLSNVFNRQPNVIRWGVMSSAMGGHRLSRGRRFGFERDLPGEALGPRAGLKHVIVSQPFDDQ